MKNLFCPERTLLVKPNPATGQSPTPLPARGGAAGRPGADAPDEKSADTSSYIARRIGMRQKNRMHGKNGCERRFGVTR